MPARLPSLALPSLTSMPTKAGLACVYARAQGGGCSGIDVVRAGDLAARLSGASGSVTPVQAG
jgi:hypothetical protein